MDTRGTSFTHFIHEGLRELGVSSASRHRSKGVGNSQESEKSGKYFHCSIVRKENFFMTVVDSCYQMAFTCAKEFIAKLSFEVLKESRVKGIFETLETESE